MRLPPLLTLLNALAFSFAGCTRIDATQARSDLDHVCRAQRNYLETRKLMKSVLESELAKERAAHFAGDVKTSLVKDALAEATRAPAGTRRKPLDLAATKAGLRDWKCPELDTL
jgi:hypothetical protein